MISGMALEINAATSESVRREEEPSDDFQEATPFLRGYCCFWNFRSRKSIWQRISVSEREAESSNGGWRAWRRGVEALKKVREWSEVVAGPKWKTFIRRFNKADGRSRVGKFQYDPSSYALNFDSVQNEEYEGDRFYRDFSARYAAVNVKSNQLKQAPSFS